ncbi:MAG: acetate--CoA ligase family protein, partial [Silicimonas sp.]|nr:acetate--CoA ligase family protein [Silicimonas sp.]
MTARLSRLFQPRSIAVIGGGAWCEQVILQANAMGYQGDIWPVHPKADRVVGYRAFQAIQDLPDAPDAAFVGVNRMASIGLVGELSAKGAGGAVCFASGFRETTGQGGDLQAELIQAAGDMPVLGPNCYGFINALDQSLLWPDQHGCRPVDSGVAILTQSSNISINLTMQKRALPIAYMVACGNMAQTSQAEIAAHLIDDRRVTALGVHVEGFEDLRAWEYLARKAHDRQVPIVALKVGSSAKAQAATITHTASLAGSDAGAGAFLQRLGIPRLQGLSEFIETLKLLHCYGPLPDGNIASISCSGGEAALIADLASGRDLYFPELTGRQNRTLSQI